MNCAELITQDHAILRRGLAILDRMVQIMEEGDRIEILDIRTVLAFLRSFGDEHHRAIEEKIIFPVLRRATPQERVLEQMLREHDEERALVAAIEDALNPKHGIGFVRNSRQLLQLLRNHLEMEESILFSAADRLLSKEEDALIVAEFKRDPSNWETPANFARLERKYAPKPLDTPTKRGLSAHA